MSRFDLRELRRFAELREGFIAAGNTREEAEKLATTSLEMLGETEVDRIRLSEAFADKFVEAGFDAATAARMGEIASAGRH